ncbi:hypothetical protein [Aquamicrobium soli]|jgi:hypothetical protein|uniref:Uncharacterized protein n=1 Tax=Aquamicrobium soli TaxID=1811518 RepID=A0ABV7KDS9_9HYPH
MSDSSNGDAGTDGAQGPCTDADRTEAVCVVLLEGLHALADVGEVEAACRLAGRACVTLRHARPVLARRFDVLLHRLTPKLTWTQPPC